MPLEALPGFGQLATLSHEVDDIVAYDPHALSAISRTVLSLYAAGHVVIDKRRLTADRLERARGVVSSIFPGLPPSYEDPVTLAYAVPAPGDAPAFIYLRRGWSDRETPPAGRAWRWMGARGQLGLFAPRAGTWRLSLRGWSYGHARRLGVAVDGRPLPTLRVVPQPTTILTDSFTVAGGVHAIDLESLDEVARVGVERRISVAIIELRLEE